MTDMIRILIADDHTLVRAGMRALIDSEPGMEVIGEAADGLEAVDKAQELDPDVVLMDLVMPRKGGIEAITEICEQEPDARILVLTSFTDDDKVFPAIKAGALGYLLKDSEPRELLQAIRSVYEGSPSLAPTIARKLMRDIQRPSDLPLAEQPLTEREVEVIRLLARGLSNHEIADQLVVSERTVRAHVSNILDKLHLANRTQAALYAIREGLTNAS
jgi:NarL family two-component system response regulator LiaR